MAIAGVARVVPGVSDRVAAVPLLLMFVLQAAAALLHPLKLVQRVIVLALLLAHDRRVCTFLCLDLYLRDVYDKAL